MKYLTVQQKEKLQEERRRKDEEEAKRLYNEFAQSFGDDASLNGKYATSPSVEITKQPSFSHHVGTSEPSSLRKIQQHNVFSMEEEEEEKEEEGDVVGKTSTGVSANKDVEEPLATSKNYLQLSSKRKRNLDTFLEEIKRDHDEREERMRYHSEHELSRGKESEEGYSTNLYVTGLPPTMDEKELAREFSPYGPIASVKILWPRSEEERLRGKNCGFVSFMERRHAEDALKYMDGCVWDGYDIRLCWGKTVRLPSKPYYVHPEWRKTMRHHYPSSTPSGVAQKTFSYESWNDEDDKDDEGDNSEEEEDFSDISEDEEQDHEIAKKGRLTRKQSRRWQRMLRHMTCERDMIGKAMYFAITHADAAEEVS
jgi:hypothetical protein